MDNRDNRPLREAMEERYIEWIVGLEKVSNIFRIVQTMLVLMQWLLPLHLNLQFREMIAEHCHDVSLVRTQTNILKQR